MIDYTREELLPLSEAGKTLPIASRRDGAVKPATSAKLSRLTTRGVRLSNGIRVRLETIRMPDNRQWTSREAIGRFVDALNNVQPPEPAAVGATLARREQQREAARTALDAAGVC